MGIQKWELKSGLQWLDLADSFLQRQLFTFFYILLNFFKCENIFQTQTEEIGISIKMQFLVEHWLTFLQFVKKAKTDVKSKTNITVAKNYKG